MSSTLSVILLCVSILGGGLTGTFLGIMKNKQKESVPKSFCDNNVIFGKFTDQHDPSIDEVVKDFKLLDF